MSSLRFNHTLYIVVFTYIFVFSQYGLKAQIAKCPDNLEIPAYRCQDACIVCNLDGIKRTSTKFDVAYGLSGCRVGVGDVFAFLAMSENLQLKISVGACRDENGDVEDFLIFNGFSDFEGSCRDTIFGETTASIFPCGFDEEGKEIEVIPGNSSRLFTAIEPLTIGQIYYVQLGTVETTVCDYTIEVIEGSTAVPELTTFSLDDVQDPCLGEPVEYNVVNQQPLTDHVFTLDGDTISTQSTAEITYSQPGTYQLCITGSNPCSQATPICYTITVNPPTTTDTTAYLCPGECFDTPDTTLCNPGTYPLTLTDRNGCDSIVNLTLIEQQSDVTELEATICNGDTLRYLGQQYFAEGEYPAVLTNQYGCDSTVNLQLRLAACPLAGTLSATDVRCHDGTDGSIRFQLASGSPPYRYGFRRLGGGPSGDGTVALRNETTTLAGLPAGTYLIEVTDDFGSVGYFNTEIKRPPVITAAVTVQNYNGSDLSCTNSADGRALVSTTGGTGAFTFDWSAGVGTGAQVGGLAAGQYTVTATDAKGCTATAQFELMVPPPLTLAAAVADEACERSGSGQLLDPVARGGTGSIVLILSQNGQTVPPANYSSLAAGTYRFAAEDANGCTADTLLEIAAPARAAAVITPTRPFVTLGEAVTLSVGEQPGSTYRWSPADSSSCADCAQLTVIPFVPTTYRVTVTSPGGCTATDSVRVEVDRLRKVYVPSAFSPDGDGTNDVLQLYSGQAVQRIRRLAVYDRWGSLQFVSDSFSPQEAGAHGWDGYVGSRPAPAGAYVWVAEVEFLDGVLEILRGSVVLLTTR